MTDWRPISEFPVDFPEGTPVLIFGTWHGEIHGPAKKPSIMLCEVDRGCFNCIGGDYYSSSAEKPTLFALVDPPPGIEPGRTA